MHLPNLHIVILLFLQPDSPNKLSDPVNYITWKADSSSKGEAKNGGIQGILARQFQSPFVRGQLNFYNVFYVTLSVYPHTAS